ncbi:hypothetical protein L7F22_034088 [Adiantum nelumboides]|nr:hypothetical protein [Adiantum nelumboides]
MVVSLEKEKIQSVKDFLEDMNDILKAACESICSAHDRAKTYANKARRKVTFEKDYEEKCISVAEAAVVMKNFGLALEFSSVHGRNFLTRRCPGDATRQISLQAKDLITQMLCPDTDSHTSLNRASMDLEQWMGKAPFEVIEGRPKSPLLLKVLGKIFDADEYSRDLKESSQKIKEAISISQQKQKAVANKRRRALAFKENDWVLLKFPKARLRHTSGKNPTRHQKYYAKLAKRYYGPFQILKPINEMAYQLKFPNHWLIHNAFHVGLLKPYKGEPPSEAITEDPPEVEDKEEVLQPEPILRHEDKVLRHGFMTEHGIASTSDTHIDDAPEPSNIDITHVVQDIKGAAFTMADNTDMFKMFITIEDILDGDNFPMWAYMMQHVLVSKGIWNIVKGIDARPGFEDVDEVAGLAARIAAIRFALLTAEQACWDVKDVQVHALIV